MTDRTDHTAQAQKWIEYSADLNPEVDWPRIAHASTLAATHAALAGVEQQRIANLIALRQADSDVLRDSEWDSIDEAIREALGLA